MKGSNTEKYIAFAISIEKEVIRIDKSRKEMTKTISYRLQFIDSARFMVNNQIWLIILLKEFLVLNVNTDVIIKSVKLMELNIKIASAFLNTKTAKII